MTVALPGPGVSREPETLAKTDAVLPVLRAAIHPLLDHLLYGACLFGDNPYGIQRGVEVFIGHAGIVEPRVEGLGHGMAEDKLHKLSSQCHVLIAFENGQVVGDGRLSAIEMVDNLDGPVLRSDLLVAVGLSAWLGLSEVDDVSALPRRRRGGGETIPELHVV